MTTLTASTRYLCDLKQETIRQEHVARFGAEEHYGVGTGPCRYPRCSCDVAVEVGGELVEGDAS